MAMVLPASNPESIRVVGAVIRKVALSCSRSERSMGSAVAQSDCRACRVLGNMLHVGTDPLHNLCRGKARDQFAIVYDIEISFLTPIPATCCAACV